MYPRNRVEPRQAPLIVNESNRIQDANETETSARSYCPIGVMAKSDHRSYDRFDQHASISSSSCTYDSEQEHRVANDRREIPDGSTMLRGPGLLMVR